ncbi:MAG TPA: hypothetical protein VLF94_03845 [Chlamydiales bacterium]|nr:hypothetical protein [Chlamydiales bacterium]
MAVRNDPQAVSLDAFFAAVNRADLDNAVPEIVKTYTHLSRAAIPEKGDVGICRKGLFIIDAPLDIGPERNLVIKADRILGDEVNLTAKKVTLICPQGYNCLCSVSAERLDKYTDSSGFFRGPMPGGSTSAMMFANLTWEKDALKQPQLFLPTKAVRV